jgi:hypothetical protein
MGGVEQTFADAARVRSMRSAAMRIPA